MECLGFFHSNQNGSINGTTYECLCLWVRRKRETENKFHDEKKGKRKSIVASLPLYTAHHPRNVLPESLELIGSSVIFLFHSLGCVRGFAVGYHLP